MVQQPKRSREPIFWGLFGLGGTWSALFSPIIILLVGIILPLGLFEGSFNILTLDLFMRSFLGKMFVFCAIALPFWCSLHRIRHLLEDLKIHITSSELIFYGAALLLTAVTFFSVFFY